MKKQLKLIQKYNALDGKIVSRKDLIDLSTELFDAIYFNEKIFGPLHIKITKLLTISDADKFEITVKNKITSPKGLSIPKQKFKILFNFNPLKKLNKSQKIKDLKKYILNIADGYKDEAKKEASTREELYDQTLLLNGMILEYGRKDKEVIKLKKFVDLLEIKHKKIQKSLDLQIESLIRTIALSRDQAFYFLELRMTDGLKAFHEEMQKFEFIESAEKIDPHKKDTSKKGLSISVTALPDTYYSPQRVSTEPKKVLDVVEKGFSQSTTPSKALSLPDYVEPITQSNENSIDQPEPTTATQPVNVVPKQKGSLKKYQTAADLLMQQKGPVNLFNIKGDLSTFLGKIEIKPVQSLMVTLDSREGGGKTHTFYQWANVFATAGYPTIIWSLEEHKTSELSKSKSRKYFSPEAFNNIVIESENDGETREDTYNRLKDTINDFDVVFIDSLSKLIELKRNINIDQELRKAFNGKLIFLILQRTSTGKPKGGSAAQFDGDIILKVDVDGVDFKNNYIYNHKNRYNDYAPLGELKYSPFYQKLLGKDPKPKTEPNNLIITAIN